MTKIAVITTFNQSGYELYARRMLETFDKYWPDEIVLYAYYEGEKPDLELGKIHLVDLNQTCPDLLEFKSRFQKFELANGIIRNEDGISSYNFLFDSIKFCHKVFCVIHAAENVKADLLFWVDADTVTHTSIPLKFLKSLLGKHEYMCFLGRTKMHSECGFLGFNLRHQENSIFMNELKDLYITGEIFKLSEWQDCYIWDLLRKKFESQNLFQSRNISGKAESTIHPFINSSLGKYMDHMKGEKRKELGCSFDSDIKIENGDNRSDRYVVREDLVKKKDKN